MIHLNSLADIKMLREALELECKLARGRDGQGALPEDFWPTYSAFANTAGGVVILGIEMTGSQPFEATRALQALVRDGFLEPHNPGRGAVYCLPGSDLPKPEEIFGAGSEHMSTSSAHLQDSSAHLTGQPSAKDLHNVHADERDAFGRLRSPHLDAPVIENLAELDKAFRRSLEVLAHLPRTKGKIAQQSMREVLISLCKAHYVTGVCLASLVDRDPDALRQQHLKPLVDEGRLHLAFPTAPTHQLQAYWSK